jgi:hypothetical protein
MAPPKSRIPVDWTAPTSDNQIMNTDTLPSALDDMHAATDAFLAGRPLDPELARRIKERADESRKKIVETNGLLNISVPYLRQDRETGH